MKWDAKTLMLSIALVALVILGMVGMAWSARRGRESAVAHAEGTRSEGLVFRVSEGVEEAAPLAVAWDLELMPYQMAEIIEIHNMISLLAKT